MTQNIKDDPTGPYICHDTIVTLMTQHLNQNREDNMSYYIYNITIFQNIVIFDLLKRQHNLEFHKLS